MDQSDTPSLVYKVYRVSSEESHLEYTLSCKEWVGKMVRGVSVSEAFPHALLIICENHPYVYKYPAHEASHEIEKYKIQCKESNDPWCMTCNDSIAIIGMCYVLSLIVCNLSDFTHQYHIQTGFIPYDLHATSYYLLVMASHEILVKPIGDLNQTICAISPPDGCVFESVASRYNIREVYALCRKANGNIAVYKYTWNGVGQPS